MTEMPQVGRHSGLFLDGMVVSFYGFIGLQTAFILDLWIGGAQGYITLVGVIIGGVCALMAIDRFHSFFSSRVCPRCWISVRVDKFQCPECGERFVGRP
jgi:hypothetical protein